MLIVIRELQLEEIESHQTTLRTIKSVVQYSRITTNMSSGKDTEQPLVVWV